MGYEEILEELRARIWAGDQGAARMVLSMQRKNVQLTILAASAAYNFRHVDYFRDWLDRKASLLQELADSGIEQHLHEDPLKRADQADVLSTVLLYLARRRKSVRLRRSAAQACQTGLVCCEKYPVRRHTHLLLRLTKADMLADDPENRQRLLEAVLPAIAKEAPSAEDQNQRARIYRRLGMLCRKCGTFWKGTGWIVRSCRVPGTPRTVRAKGLAALAGFGN